MPILPRIILTLLIIGSWLVQQFISNKWGGILSLISGLLTLIYLFSEDKILNYFNKEKEPSAN